MTKSCSKCKIPKEISEYHRNRRSPDGYRNTCKACQAEIGRAWDKANPARAYRKTRKHYMKATYGMTPEHYDAMLAQQEGRCAICNEEPTSGRGCRLYVDHCHDTGRVRGLLCHSCNSLLGFMRDTPQLAQAAIAYLTEVRC